MADKSDKVDKPDAVENTIEKLKPLLQQVSFGGVLGYCSGYALKQLGKATAFVVGIGFLGLQTAQHYGYIEVDWVKVRDDALKPLDTVRRISNRVMERTRGSHLTTLFCVYFLLDAIFFRPAMVNLTRKISRNCIRGSELYSSISFQVQEDSVSDF